MPIYEQLKKEVIDAIAKNGAMGAVLRQSCIHWRTPMVGIQDILLKTPPTILARTATGARELSQKEYVPILKNWKQNFIGGSTKLQSNCEGKYWYPPKGSRLYRLQRIEEHFGGYNGYEYFLLRYKGKEYFLVKRFGERNHNNDLRVIGEEGNEIYFGDALQNALSWKPGKKREPRFLAKVS
jgi:hypothetical protein